MDDTPIVQSCCLLAVFGKLEEIRHRNRYPSLKGVVSHTPEPLLAQQSEKETMRMEANGCYVKRLEHENIKMPIPVQEIKVQVLSSFYTVHARLENELRENPACTDHARRPNSALLHACP